MLGRKYLGSLWPVGWISWILDRGRAAAMSRGSEGGGRDN